MSGTGKGSNQERRYRLLNKYSASLASYLEGNGEIALQNAYEVSREAIGEMNLGLLDMAILHHEALEQVLPPTIAELEKGRLLKAAGEFFAESMSTYEMAYRSYKDKNAALRHINDVLEQEVRRIAHVLHDEAGQSLFAAQISLSMMERRVDPSLIQDLRNISNVLNQAGEQLRVLSHQLRPTILDDLGLVPAIDHLAKGIFKQTGIPVSVRSSIQRRCPPSIEAALFRVVQEGLTNMTKHSRATNAEVVLEREGPTLHCTVSDNGIGFDTGNWPDTAATTGLGLVGIRERVDSIGGTLHLQSQPGKGTQLLINIPCEV
jgi:signal transduction histidine kinase